MREVDNIPKGWVETTLKDIVNYTIDNRGRNPEYYTDTGIPVIDNFMIKGDRDVDLNLTKRFIDENLYETFIRKYLKPKDVIITLVGNGYGNVSIAPNIKSVIIQNTVGLRANSNGDNYFIFYNLSYRKKRLTDLNRGAAQPSIKVGDLMQVKINLPPIQEQQAIASILTTFDDKIELLQAQNETLEATAQTIFKEWFGKYQVGDELPEGWRVGRFGELFNLMMGLSPKGDTYNFENIGVPLINEAGDYENGLLAPKRHTSKPTRVNKVGDLVFCIRGTIGNIVFADKKYCLGRGVAALSPKNQIDKYFNYLTLSSIIASLTRNATGSVIQGLSKSDINDEEIIIPNRDSLNMFGIAIKGLFDKIDINRQQIQTLQQTRDTLLPKLMSGELRVDEFKD